MIIEETINGLLFQEQRTYKIYKSEADRTAGKFTLSTSDERKFLQNKELARQKAEKQDPNNKFIVL